MDRMFADPLVAAGIDAAGQESRARDSLFLMARMRTPLLTEALPVRIRNLSAGGLMAEFPTPLDRDTPVEVDVRGIGWIPGRIAWYAEGRAGVAFLAPIDPQRARKPVGVARTR
jgi:hypothetical protein